MYHYHPQRLNSPPPSSAFRRPWSPVEFEPHSCGTAQALRHQPSDAEASIEVLDLANYSRMAPHAGDNRYNGDSVWNTPSYPEYPVTPPRSFSLASRSSMPTSPPSLTSGATSASHGRSARLHTPPPSRHFSLPPHRTTYPFPEGHSGRSHNFPWSAEPLDVSERHGEVDISAFPEWSRNWYMSDKSVSKGLDPYRPIPTFDPAQVSASYGDFGSLHSARPYPMTNESHQDLLPWTLDDESSNTRNAPEMKEERMRMLEREFGRTGRRQDTWYSGSKIIGSVDAKGNIITPGPKKRIIMRYMQGTFAFGATIASLYSALILKPVGSPPPRGTVPAYLLYILSVITVIVLNYLFVIRPCCCSGKRTRKPSQEGPGGMMVLPVQQLAGAPEKGKRRKEKGKDNTNGSVSVNLIIDPNMLSGGHGRRDEEESDYDEPDAFSSRPRARRRGLFEGLAMEEQWMEARRQLKQMLYFDTTLLLVWGAEFVVILLGKRCPVGKFEGWCDGYNTSTALAAFLSVSFGFSVFFGVKDLHLSKVSPRART